MPKEQESSTAQDLTSSSVETASPKVPADSARKRSPAKSTSDDVKPQITVDDKKPAIVIAKQESTIFKDEHIKKEPTVKDQDEEGQTEDDAPPAAVRNETFQEALLRAKRIAEELKKSNPPTDSSSKRQRDGEDVVGYHAEKRGSYSNSSDNQYAQQQQQPYQSVSGYQQWNPEVPHITATQNTSDFLMVPGNHVGYLIGRGGQTLKSIEADTGVKMQFDAQDTPQGQRRCVLQGTLSEIDAAKALIQVKIKETEDNRRHGGGGGGGGGSGAKVEIRIPTSKVGLVIGRGASVVKDLSSRSGCRIFIVPENQMPPGSSPAERIVELTGTPEAVTVAKQLIFAIVEGQNLGLGSGPGGGSHGGGPVTVVEIPEDMVGLVIGKGGESIKSIIANSRAMVKIDTVVSGKFRQVYISGDHMAVEAAKQLISDVVNRKNDPFGGQTYGGYGQDYGYAAAQAYYSQQQGGYASAPGYAAPQSATYDPSAAATGSYAAQPAYAQAATYAQPAYSQPGDQAAATVDPATAAAQQAAYQEYYQQYYAQYAAAQAAAGGQPSADGSTSAAPVSYGQQYQPYPSQ